MQTLVQHLEAIVDAHRKKQIRINGRQVMITPEVAETILRVHDALRPCNQTWFLALDATRMIQLAARLEHLMEETA